ncbi:Uncharacterised protein [Actinobacillus pleuropneumoniae]|nr:Uncharacterised protein [Actinobacillus pleuropneumoniae]
MAAAVRLGQTGQLLQVLDLSIADKIGFAGSADGGGIAKPEISYGFKDLIAADQKAHFPVLLSARRRIRQFLAIDEALHDRIAERLVRIRKPEGKACYSVLIKTYDIAVMAGMQANLRDFALRPAVQIGLHVLGKGKQRLGEMAVLQPAG